MANLASTNDLSPATSQDLASAMSQGQDLASEAVDNMHDELQFTPLSQIEAELFVTDKLGQRFPLLQEAQASDEDAEEDTTYVIEQRFFSEKIRESELPEEIMLELLTVLSCQDLDEDLTCYGIDQFGRTQFLRARKIKLRRLLFNNPFLDYFDSQTKLSESEKWKKWSDSFSELNFRETDKTKTLYRVIVPDDVKQWQSSFKSFSDFTKAINLLRSWAYVHDNKQWSYNFIFPFGPDCLYSEITIDHIFKYNYLSGAGTLLFSMLQRAQDPMVVASVYRMLNERFLKSDNAFNVLAQLLEGQADNTQHWIELFKDDVRQQKVKPSYETATNVVLGRQILNSYKSSKTSYLPYRQHKLFDQLCQDFKNILELKHPLNQSDLFHALSIIGTLNMMIYYLEVSKNIFAFFGHLCNTDIVVECNHAVGSNLRSLATSRLNENDSLIKDAIQSMLKYYLSKMFPNLNQRSMLNQSQFEFLMDKVAQTFNMTKFLQSRRDFNKWLQDFKNESSVLSDEDESDAASLVSDLSAQDTQGEAKISFDFVQKHFCRLCDQLNNHFRPVHRSYCRHIGLASRDSGQTRLVRAYRYILPDDLVRALVLSTVDESEQLMLLDVFLERLYTKYHLVIGPKEAGRYRNHDGGTRKDENQFKANLDAFKEQLLRLGFLINLSDTDAYIKNPYLD